MYQCVGTWLTNDNESNNKLCVLVFGVGTPGYANASDIATNA